MYKKLFIILFFIFLYQNVKSMDEVIDSLNSVELNNIYKIDNLIELNHKLYALFKNKIVSPELAYKIIQNYLYNHFYKKNYLNEASIPPKSVIGDRVNILSYTETKEFRHKKALLYEACKHDLLTIVYLLYVSGFDISCTFIDSENKYFLSNLWHYISKFKSIWLNIYNTNFLMLAVNSNSFNVAKFLIQNTNSINDQNSIRMTALMYAVINGNQEMVKLLIESGAHLDSIYYTWSPLVFAIYNNDLHMSRLLIKAGADLSFPIKDDFCLERFREITNISKFTKILTREVAVDINDIDFEWMFIYACRIKSYEVGEWLKEEEVDLDEINKNKTPLMGICSYNSPYSFYIAKSLIESGANLDVTDYKNFTALIFAITNNNWDIARLLVNHSAIFNYVDANGSPLMYAIIKGNIDFVKFLICKGADIKLLDHKGRTAIDIARDLGPRDIYIYLLELKDRANYENQSNLSNDCLNLYQEEDYNHNKIIKSFFTDSDQE